MRKLSRRATVLTVALGILLTASIALAVTLVDGTTEFQVQAENVDDPVSDLGVTVERTNEDDGPISETQRARYTIEVHNPNDEDVTLGADPVTFTVDSGGDADCTIDDLQFNDPDELSGVTIPAGGTVDDNFSVKLRSGSGDDCDNATLTITVTVSGETVDEPAPVSGSSSV